MTQVPFKDDRNDPAYVNPTLPVGSGFSGATPTPSPVGSVSDDGYGAKCIARWDVVPFQTFTTTINVAVVAFHINGIDRVEFSVNGGAWTAVTEQTLNSETGVWEYWGTIDADDFSGNSCEVRAIVYPANAGTPRLLAGEYDEVGDIDSVWNGNHSLFLYPDKDNSLPAPVVYCSPTGSDSTGDGSSGNPFRNPAKAAASMASPSADGGIVYLKAGSYSYGPPPWPQATNTSRWLTIMPAPGVAQEDAIIVDGDTGGLGTTARLVRVKGVTINHTPGAGGVPRFAGGGIVWFDSVVVNGTRTEDYSHINTGAAKAWYVTDSYMTQSRNALRGATFQRGCTFGTLSGSPFGDSPCVIDCQVGEYDASGTEFHGDVFHWFYESDDRENIVVYNVAAPNFNNQAIFAEVADWTTPHYTRLDNVAIVNFHCEKQENGPESSYWERDTNHLIFRNVSIPDQNFYFLQEDYSTSISDVMIVGMVAKSFGGTEPPDGTVAEHSHTVDPTVYQSWLYGTDVTTGAEQYMTDVDSERSLQTTSRLRGRVRSAYWKVPTDAYGRVRPLLASIGALEDWKA